MSTDVAIREHPGELTVQDLTAQVRKIQEVMQAVMREGEHYGVIPGTNKPTLLKPGAEKLCLTFRLAPDYDVKENWHGDDVTMIAKCTLTHMTSGMVMGSGFGLCSTKEVKYAYRQAQRVCPKCGKDTIIKGKAEYGGGWLCFAKKGGCGAKFKAGDASIESQETGRIANPDKADTYNTVLKMATKRALVAAVLVVTAASDIFTQDIEDLPKAEPQPEPDAPPQQAPKTVTPEVEPALNRGQRLNKLSDKLAEITKGMPLRGTTLLKHVADTSSFSQLTDERLATLEAMPDEAWKAKARECLDAVEKA